MKRFRPIFRTLKVFNVRKYNIPKQKLYRHNTFCLHCYEKRNRNWNWLHTDLFVSVCFINNKPKEKWLICDAFRLQWVVRSYFNACLNSIFNAKVIPVYSLYKSCKSGIWTNLTFAHGKAGLKICYSVQKWSKVTQI